MKKIIYIIYIYIYIFIYIYIYIYTLTHGAYLNRTSNAFAYFLIIFLGHDWLGFFLNK